MNNKFEKGDKVSYVISKRVGRGFKISAREGTFDRYYAKDSCVVKTRNGILLTVPISSVTPIGRRNALTTALVGDKE